MKCEEKVKYKTRKAAERVKKNPHFKRKKRVYLCPECGFYHLTESFMKKSMRVKL